MTSREDNRRLAEAYAEAMGIGDTNLDDESTHDYAACQDPICALREAYGDGYTTGKEMAYFEVRNLAYPAARALHSESSPMTQICGTDKSFLTGAVESVLLVLIPRNPSPQNRRRGPVFRAKV